jgi:hypothetical protein
MRMKTRHIGNAAVIAAGWALGAIAPGCTPSAGSYCDEVCSCIGCTEDARADCTISVEKTRQTAADHSCSSEFDAYFSCLHGETSCVGGKASANGCETDAARLTQCGGSVLFTGNACDRLLATLETKSQECGVDLASGGQQPECTAALARQAACFEPCYKDMDCILFTDPGSPAGGEASKRFSDCILPCK